MKFRFNKYIILILVILVASGAIASMYLFVYKPLTAKNAILKGEIQSKTSYLAQLRGIESSKEQYEAELLEYRKLMERYHLYFEEYGSYPKLIEMLTDVERRLDSEILGITKGESDVQIIMNIKYSSLKDLLTELESIEFFYNCNNLKISQNDASEFSLEDILRKREDNNVNDMIIEVSATFSNDLKHNISSIESEIEQLLLELGFTDAVVTP